MDKHEILATANIIAGIHSHFQQQHSIVTDRIGMTSLH